MSRTKSVLKTAMALGISTMMALPGPSFAKDEQGRYAPPELTDELPVFAQEIQLPDGRTAVLMGAQIPFSQEREVVRNLVQYKAESTVLNVAGENDPALAAAAQTGRLQQTNVNVLGSLESAPLINSPSVPETLRGKLYAKLKAIGQRASREPLNGLLYAAFYSGTQGGFTAYTSAHVLPGLAVFNMYMLWNSFVLTKPSLWGKFLEVGGRGGIGLANKVASLMGRELTEQDKRVYEVAGKFAASWTVTTLQGAYVKAFSGDFSGLHGALGFLEGFADSAISGVQNNYNIWDAVVMKRFEEGKLSERKVQWYFKGQMVIGAILETLAFRGVSGVGLFLTAVTGAGVIYLSLHPERQANVFEHAQKITVVFRSGVAYIANPESPTVQRLSESIAQRVSGALKMRARRSTCASYLSPQFFNRTARFEDMQ